MPRRNDLESVLILGSGPIVIGQACEFDYSGTQAVKAIREEGIRVVLLNSNPATIMTDPEFADRTYVEPMDPTVLERIIERERPTAVLPTLGGQTALNLALEVADRGVLERYGTELIGATVDAIRKAEDRSRFKAAMEKIGLESARSAHVGSLDEARVVAEELGFPVIIRPSFTMGGSGGSIAFNKDEFDQRVQWGLDLSPTHEVLIEESILGWKEFELEVMRDRNDNVVIVCSIENFDPMGVHTGDSITVAPAQTLTDKEYQVMRDAACRIIREIGVETGGSNIQFATDPTTGRLIVIEMNPRVSRSSALASKATGFPIAKIAAKLAIGYTLDEITNDITEVTPACFEPTIDYVVTKTPRFAFEKFPGATPELGPQMKSVGEAMAIGRSFQESLSKAVQSLEIGRNGLSGGELADTPLAEQLVTPYEGRLWSIVHAMVGGSSIEEINRATHIDPWFLRQLEKVVTVEQGLAERFAGGLEAVDAEAMRELKRTGVSDARIAAAVGVAETAVRERRRALGVNASFLRVDTCAAEFVAHTPYLYSTYETECEAEPTERRKVMILGGGPNRIGQGIEFDYCCVHAAFALRDDGYETIMVNCNPETVSTDYDTSDRLYFEPLTFEHVMNIVEREKPEGVIVQFGGQTPLKLAVPLERAGVPIVGTSPDSIDRAEDRERFQDLIVKLGLNQPPNGLARSQEEAVEIANRLGYPVLVRPSYVLGGRAMQIVQDQTGLERYMRDAIRASEEHPVLIDRFLDDAIEVDVDAVCDGQRVFVAGILEHIEQAGVHSGDSAMCLPPHSLSPEMVAEIDRQTEALAMELGVRGLMNVQFAIHGGALYVIEVNPRASRTVPFVSKAIGIQLAKVASRVMLGQSLDQQGVPVRRPDIAHRCVKESVFPFVKFPGVDTVLGPEMRSTGEVMGVGMDFADAFAKASLGAGLVLPREGTVFVSVRDEDKEGIVEVGRQLRQLGFHILATTGTRDKLVAAGIEAELIAKVGEGRPHIVDAMLDGKVQMVINTPSGGRSLTDSFSIRRTALERGIPLLTSAAAAAATARAIESITSAALEVRALQDLYDRGA